MSKRKKLKYDDRPIDLCSSTVPIKLSTLLSNEDPIIKDALFRAINEGAMNLSITANEAMMLANLHTQLCLESNQPLPKLNNGFFKSCCAIVTEGGKKIHKDGLVATFNEHYKPLRPLNHRSIQNKLQNQARSVLAIQIETATKNFYVQYFRKYLYRYVQAKYGLEKKQEYGFLRPIFPKEEDEVIDPDRLSADQREVYDWFGGHNPFLDKDIEFNVEFYVERLFIIRSFLEQKEKEDKTIWDLEEQQRQKEGKKRRKRKGFRLFSLLPLKGDFSVSYMNMDIISLVDVLKSLDQSNQIRIVRTLMGRLYQTPEIIEWLQWRLTRDSIFSDDRFGNNIVIIKALWSTLFRVDKLETVNRKFVGQIGTNGYGATVLMTKPGTPKQKGVKDDEYDPLPTDCSGFTTFIGLDPGRTFLYTTFDGSRTIDGKSQHKQCSTKEWRHLAGMNDRRRRSKELRETEPEYDRVIKELTNHSLKVSGLEPLKENIKVYLKHSWYLFNFHARHPYRKWRFTASVMAPKAMKQIIDRLIGKNEKVLIGFGDWSQQDGFLRGSDTAPVKKFKRELRKRATVVKIDEYCTSQTCSKCHLKEMVNEVYDGEECHQVLKCKTCKTYWQRDHNASVNIYGLLIGMVNGEERLEAMRRVVAPQRGRKKAKIGT